MSICTRLQNKTGIDKFWFRLFFVIWFFHTGWALLWYIIIGLLIED